MSKRKHRQDQIETATSAENATPAPEMQTAAVDASASMVDETPASVTSGSPAMEFSGAPSPEGDTLSASKRFALLAASVALAAAFGAVLGSVGTFGLLRALTPSASAEAVKIGELNRDLPEILSQLKIEVAALKTSVDASNRLATTQFGKMAERLDRTDRAQAEPAAKLAVITDSLSRLEQRVAAVAPTQEVTGSVAARAEVKEPPKPAILEGWVIRDIYRGRALVESRNGYFEIAAGSNLPGVGRVDSITQQNGRWVVVTPKGIIVSMR
jgi:hypothetical protein